MEAEKLYSGGGGVNRSVRPWFLNSSKKQFRANLRLEEDYLESKEKVHSQRRSKQVAQRAALTI